MLCKRNEYIQIDLEMATKLQHNYINTLSCGRTYAIRIHNYPLKSLDNLNTPTKQPYNPGACAKFLMSFVSIRPTAGDISCRSI